MVELAPAPSEHVSVARYLTEPTGLPEEALSLTAIENRIVCGDALDVLAALPDDCVDLVHTSPPYNIDRPYALSPPDKNPLADYRAFLERAIDHLKRVVRPGGSIFWQTGYTKDEDDASEIIPIDLLSYDMFRGNPLPLRLWDRIIWRYWGGHAFKRKFTNKHETILWFVKPGAEPVFNVDHVRERAKEYDKRNNFWGRNPGNVWEVDRVAFGSTEQTSHIAVFPEEVTERIVRACSEPGSLILDPFSGSGTVPKVARGLGRRWLGIEISRVYAAEASIRVGFQQPSEADSLASELIKHVAFGDKQATLGCDEVRTRLRAWAVQSPIGAARAAFENDQASVFRDNNGRNSTKRDVWMKYDELLETRREPPDPVVLADRLLGTCYKLRGQFNGVSRYRSALAALEQVVKRLTDDAAMSYVSGIADQEPSSFRLTGGRIEFFSTRRQAVVLADGLEPRADRAAQADGGSLQGRMEL
ncbi:MAG: site-specific DNA-methyltransferase [Chloroflexi bacterium]|nr:site-specific DNA-methyltransferase [Chloroflexota bacterium]